MGPIFRALFWGEGLDSPLFKIHALDAHRRAQTTISAFQPEVSLPWGCYLSCPKIHTKNMLKIWLRCWFVFVFCFFFVVVEIQLILHSTSCCYRCDYYLSIYLPRHCLRGLRTPSVPIGLFGLLSKKVMRVNRPMPPSLTSLWIYLFVQSFSHTQKRVIKHSPGPSRLSGLIYWSLWIKGLHGILWDI